jgi:aminoglycoside phosphotransferase (APT) family kinase protein
VFEQLGAYLARIHAIRLDGYGELKPAESAGEDRSHEFRYVGTGTSLSEFVVRGVERTVHELQNLQAQPQVQPHWPADALSPDRLSRLRERFDRERRLLDLPRAVLVHGDYRFKNVLLDGSRVTGIVDYELAAAGDPAMDLAWLGCEDIQTEAEWTAIWRGYGNTPDARFERRLLLYKLWWSLRRLWWQVAWPDPEGIAADLANIAHVEAQLDR